MTRANTRRKNMEREKKGNKRKAWRIRRATTRRVNIKLRESSFFLRWFFWTETKWLRQKKQDIFQSHWKKNNGKMFLKIIPEKIVKLKKNKGFFQKEMIFFAISRTKRQFFYETRQEDWYKKITKNIKKAKNPAKHETDKE